MTLDVSDQHILDAVNEARHEIYYKDESPNDPETLLQMASAIATKATLKILGANIDGGNLSQSPIDFPLIFAEWAQKYNLKTHFDRFLAIMVYLREKEAQATVSTADIGRMYDKARWRKPANMADVFAKGADRIYFAEADADDDGLKLWQMTRTGYDYLTSLRVEV